MSRKMICFTVLLFSLTMIAVAQQTPSQTQSQSNDAKDVAVLDADLHFTQLIGHTLAGNAVRASSSTTCDTFLAECRAACVSQFGNKFTPQLAGCFASCQQKYGANCTAG